VSLDTNKYQSSMPIEVAGWYLRKVGAVAGSWVLTITPDNLLPCQLVVRAPTGLNVVWGLPVEQGPDDLFEGAVTAAGIVKQLDAIPAVRWGQSQGW
jgi:hypothetical protein